MKRWWTPQRVDVAALALAMVAVAAWAACAWRVMR